MKSIRPVLVFALLGTIILAVLWYKHKNTEEPYIEGDNTTLPITERVVKKEFNKENDYTTIAIEYPYIRDASDDFNAQILNFITERADEQLKDSEENWKARFETSTPQDPVPEIPAKDDRFQMYGMFDVIQANDTYVSILFKLGAFTGGAHGYEDLISYNYNIKEKKPVTLKDLFSNDANYLETISFDSRKDLVKQLVPGVVATKTFDELKYSNPDDQFALQMIYDGTDPVEDNFNTFTFTQDAITLYFQQYQVAAYVAGQPEVVLPRK